MFRRSNLKLRKAELRFKDFILNFNYYLNEIQKDKNKIKQLKKEDGIYVLIKINTVKKF